MKKANTKTIVLAALMAAIIAVSTRFTAIPIPGTSGYVHVGDSFVFLAAALLPTPFAVLSAALGGALADMMYGAMVYVLPTAIVKALMAAAFFGSRDGKLLSKKNLLCASFGIVILCAGYYLSECIIFGSFIAPLAQVVWNLAQGVFGVVAFSLFAAALDGTKLRERIGI